MDSLKKSFQDIATTAKFEGIHLHITTGINGRLLVTVDATGSVDLPGNLDATVAMVASMLGLGNSSVPSVS